MTNTSGIKVKKIFFGQISVKTVNTQVKHFFGPIPIKLRSTIDTLCVLVKGKCVLVN
jgi:hypothetical protein